MTEVLIARSSYVKRGDKYGITYKANLILVHVGVITILINPRNLIKREKN